jgi:hypothetical protein
MAAGDLLRKEAEAYAAFAAAVEAIPRDRWEEPILSDGWSVKDAVWHVAFWWQEGVEEFDARAAGTFQEVDHPAEVTDATNARVLAEGRAKTLAAVSSDAAAIRARMLDAFAPLAGDADAAETFRSETIEHYEEHLPALRAAAAS